MGRLSQLEVMELWAYSKESIESQFFFRIDDHGFTEPRDISISVRSTADWPSFANYYEMSLEMRAGEWQSVWMSNKGDPEFKGKGITQALLPALSRILERDIVSSPPFQDGSDRRSDSATTIWLRLVASGLAIPEGDRFRLLYSVAKIAPHRR